MSRPQPSSGTRPNPKLPAKGSIPGLKKSQLPASNGQYVQPTSTVSSVLAIYLFEQEDTSSGKFHCVFFDEKRVYVIPTLAISSFIVDNMVKGLTYKLYLGSSGPPSVSVHNLDRFEHILATKVEIPTIDSFDKAPYFLCKVTVSKGTERHANFQLLKVGPCNIQIPFNVLPVALALKSVHDEHIIKVAFTTRNIKTRASQTGSTATRRMPFVEPNFFTFCDRSGNDLPAPLPMFSISPESIEAVRKGFMANLVVGVPGNSSYLSLAATDSNLLSWKVNRSTSAKAFLGSLASHLRSLPASDASTNMVKYFDSHFGSLIRNGKGWGSPFSSPPQRPTVLFFLGFSDALSVQVADALALDLHKTYGINSRIVAPAALGSSSGNFCELNTPRASPFAQNLFEFSQHLQLGLLDGAGCSYNFDDPDFFLPFLAYDVCSDLTPTSIQGQHLLLPKTVIDIEGVPVPDASYLTDPTSLFGLYIASSESSTREAKFLHLISSAGAKHVPFLDFTGRTNKWVLTLALLHKKNQRDSLATKLKSINGISCMTPTDFHSPSDSKDTLVTVLMNAIAPNVLIKVLADERFGCLKDKMLATSNTTIKMALPAGTNQHEFTLKLQKFNSLLGSECFISTFGAHGLLTVKGLRAHVIRDPAAPHPFAVIGPFAASTNETIISWATSSGASNPRRILHGNRRTDLVVDLPQLKAAEIRQLQPSLILRPFTSASDDLEFPISLEPDWELLFGPEETPSLPITALPTQFETALAKLVEVPSRFFAG